MRAHPADVCCCGDYRRQHVGGEGRCTLGNLCSPAPCRRFRLNRPAPVIRWHRGGWYSIGRRSPLILLGPFRNARAAATEEGIAAAA